MRSEIVHKSLVTPITIMGLPRAVFWTNVILCIDMFFIGAWWLVGLSIVIHVCAAMICKNDPEIFDILLEYYSDDAGFLEG